MKYQVIWMLISCLTTTTFLSYSMEESSRPENLRMRHVNEQSSSDSDSEQSSSDDVRIYIPASDKQVKIQNIQRKLNCVKSLVGHLGCYAAMFCCVGGSTMNMPTGVVLGAGALAGKICVIGSIDIANNYLENLKKKIY